MKWLVWLCAAALAAQAVVASARPAASPSPTYANARVVSLAAEGRTLTVRGEGVGTEKTYAVVPEARAQVRTLSPGDEVVLAFRAGGSGQEGVTLVERAASPARASPASAGRRRDAARPSSRAVVVVEGALAPPRAPSPAPTPAASMPSPDPTPLPTDTVGPFRDPRVDPDFDPRQNPLRDPRVIPGLSEPAPTPAPQPSPSTP